MFGEPVFILQFAVEFLQLFMCKTATLFPSFHRTHQWSLLHHRDYVTCGSVVSIVRRST